MEFDDEKEFLIFNDEDLNYILKTYIRTYRYFRENKLPRKIIVRVVKPEVELSEVLWREVKGKKITVEFEIADDKSGSFGARGSSKSTKTKRGSKSGASEPKPSK